MTISEIVEYQITILYTLVISESCTNDITYEVGYVSEWYTAAPDPFHYNYIWNLSRGQWGVLVTCNCNCPFTWPNLLNFVMTVLIIMNCLSFSHFLVQIFFGQRINQSPAEQFIIYYLCYTFEIWMNLAASGSHLELNITAQKKTLTEHTKHWFFLQARFSHSQTEEKKSFTMQEQSDARRSEANN